MTRAQLESLGMTDRSLVAAFREAFPEFEPTRVDLSGDTAEQTANRRMLFDTLAARWMGSDLSVLEEKA